MSSLPVARLLERLQHVRPSGERFEARCPVPDHHDHKASLSVAEGKDGRALVHCHKGCAPDAIVAALGLTLRDLMAATDALDAAPGHLVIVATYDYCDETGASLSQVVRSHPKAFRQRRPDGRGGWIWDLKGVRRVLYRLDRLAATRPEMVFIVEGEKDVATLESREVTATTNAGGAGKWRDDYTRQLVTAGVKRVCVLPDNDEPGRAHARAVAQSCRAAGLEVRILELLNLPEKGDVSHWLAAGGTKVLLLELARTCPVWTPAPVASARTGTATVTLPDALKAFRDHLHLDDPAPLYAVAATLVANLATGDPVWLLIVGPPSSGKTEIISAATALYWVHPAAKVTEASLLSGTSKRDKAKGATGGLLRQIGDFGVLLVKDFTSVLAQNHDARNEAMAALREVYDGAWHRPVGTDGGQVLVWNGKCGLIGGVTPALDQYGQVLAALGDRFLLLRLPDADVAKFGAAALDHADREVAMRQALRAALTGLVTGADISRVNRTRSAADQQRLIRLAAYTCRVRTAVARDGFRQEVLYLPQVEGPGRVVKAFSRLLGGLEAIGCTEAEAWDTLMRIASDCAPALRTVLIRELVRRNALARTSDLAAAVEMVTRTASRHLEDLALIGVAVHSKQSQADNAPDLWAASPWLREHWPYPLESKTEKYPPAHSHTSTAPPVEAPTTSPDGPSGVDFSPTSAGEGAEEVA